MNLFRSEEHARRWSQFQPKSEEGFITLTDLAGFFGTESRLKTGDGVRSYIPTILALCDSPTRGKMSECKT